MPTIRYGAPLQILVAVRGHPFDRTAFDAMFQAMDGIAATMVDQPAAAQLMNPDGMAPYDALVLYDMPGLDFEVPEAERPRHVDPGERFRRGFEALLESGKGIVALHHALAGWPAWPDYRRHLGGAFLYRGNGTESDSGYRQQIDYSAEVVAPDHPVMAGIPARFPMRDELYLAEIDEAAVTPLLRADYAFTAGNFHSAAAAMKGRMFDNRGWAHPPGSNLIGWVKQARNSPIVYLQPGDDRATYDDPVYRRLIENAVRFVSGARPRDAA